MELTEYHTNLAKTSNIMATLDWKLSAITEAGLPTDTALSDYIALTVDEIKAEIAYLNEVKQVATERINARKSHLEDVLEGSAIFLENFGVDRMDGGIISSITITKAKPASTKDKFVRDCTAKEMEATLLNTGLAHLETVDVPEIFAKVKINRRKTGTVTIEE